MGSLLTERYADKIQGVLSCYDRIVIQGTLPEFGISPALPQDSEHLIATNRLGSSTLLDRADHSEILDGFCKSFLDQVATLFQHFHDCGFEEPLQFGFIGCVGHDLLRI